MSVASVVRYLIQRNATVFVVLVVYGIVSFLFYRIGWLHSDVVVTSAIFFIVVLGLDLLFRLCRPLELRPRWVLRDWCVQRRCFPRAISNGTFSFGGCRLTISAALSYVLGRVCLRLSGSYFMLGTLAFGIMVHAIITVWYTVTGGDGGFGGIPRPYVGAIALTSDWSFGILAWGCTAILFWLTYQPLALQGRARGSSHPQRRSCGGVSRCKCCTRENECLRD